MIAIIVSAGSVLAILVTGILLTRMTALRPQSAVRPSADKADIVLRQLFPSNHGQAEVRADALIARLPDDEWLAVIKAEAAFRDRTPVDPSPAHPTAADFDAGYRPVPLDVVLAPSSL